MTNFSCDSFNNKLNSLSDISSDCEVRNSELKAYSRLKKNVEFRDSVLGEYSYVSSFSTVNGSQIGRFCSIGPGSFIGLWEHNTYTTTHSFYLYETSGGFVEGYKNYDKDVEQVIMGSDVWVGANVTIKKGVCVGHGAIIGAGSVVVKDVPDYAVVGGVPAKIIKYRFSELDIEFLLDSQWWGLSRDILQDMVNKKVWDSFEKLKLYLTSITDKEIK